jgi:ATP-binding cassette subfamily F protein 3
MRAKDVLLEALSEFTGTVVFVSHDRYFIDKLATKVVEIGGGEVQVYPGNYEEYRWRKQAEADGSLYPGLSNGTAAAAAAVVEPAGSPKGKRLNPMKLQQLRNRASDLEERIAELESEINQAELSFSDFRSAEESVRAANHIEERRTQLTSLIAEWENVSEQIETAG